VADPEVPFVSVVVPVYNDEERLAQCLEALERQTYPSDQFEVVVVDNGSDESLDWLVEGFPHARLAVELRPGSYAARNAGLSIAKGSVIAFTDADCLPAADWIQEGVEALGAEPRAGVVAGSIEMIDESGRGSGPVALYQQLRAFPQRENVYGRHYGPTANVFTLRQVFDRVGLFDANLKSGGDREWGQRVHASGRAVVYAEGVRVQHPARATLRELSLKLARVAGGQCDRAKREGRWGLGFFLKASLSDLRPPVRAIRAIWREAGVRRPLLRIQLALLCCFVGYVRFWERVRIALGGSSRRL
jgi:glycosyltransferase involved in cell wall biosynthesis